MTNEGTGPIRRAHHGQLLWGETCPSGCCPTQPNHYLSDLRAERDALRAVVARVEELVTFYDRHEYSSLNVDDLRNTLSGDLRAATPTDSEPAATERQGEAEGAGDGV